MTYRDFLLRICVDAETEVRRAYTCPHKLKGALRGIDEARETVNPADLRGLLSSARQDTADCLALAQAMGDPDDMIARYWILRLRDQQLEWVATVVSAMLYNEGEKPIVPPTLRAWNKAASILGRGA
ncbi:hypothetical protein GURKE_01190 [Brevundimonas phage vB_BpoS-Gurke]|uniref:Uncharacterized protein n=1 Tax=Brevundimonas phage vB_BpoS-Gurke TaxID=2948599 RepID=A0A9E7N3F3_9CAUD|nr:hypothetical protein GURKE_01190 [Brevundimonas phage vB_BpoS-Gurke]